MLINNSIKDFYSFISKSFYKFSFVFLLIFNVGIGANCQTDPSSIPGLTLWLSADSGIVLSSGYVQEWQDISGNGNHFSATTPALRPFFMNTSSLNNEPLLQFDGTDQLISTNNFTFTNATVIVVSTQKTGDANYGRLIDHSYATGFWIGREVGNKIGGGFIESNAPYGNFNVIQNEIPSIVSLIRSGATTSSYMNSQPFSTPTRTTFSNPTILNKIALGAAIDGLALGRKDIYEVIIYNNAISVSNRQVIETYLRNKYSSYITIGPDTTVTDNVCSINLNAPAGFSNLLWSTGATTSSISVNASGQYWLQGTDVFGYVSSDTIQVNLPEIQIPSITGICVNDSILWDADLGPGFTYLWSPGGETTPSIYISTPGIYSVQVTDALLCTKNSGDVTFTIDNYSQTAFLGNDTSLCSGNFIGLQIGAPETISYVWPDASTGVQYAVDTTGNYFVESTNVNGCVARDTIHVTIVGTAPFADFDFQNACLGESIDFVDQSIPVGADNIAIWNWDMGDGTPILTDQNPSHTFASSGIFNVVLYVESIGGCGAFHNESVQVYVNPTANFSSLGHCVDQNVEFTNTSIAGDATITDYLWNFDMPWTGAYNISDLPVPMRIFDPADTYDIWFQVTDANGCTDTIVIPLVIDPSPVADFLYADVCLNTPLQFVNTSVTEPLSTYLWNFGDFTTSISSNPIKTYTSAGLFTVSLEVTNSFGCIDVMQNDVEVFPNPIAIMDLGAYCMGTYMEANDISTISSGSIDSSVWIFNTTDTLIGGSVNYLIPSMGQQQVQLISYSEEGCWAAASQFIQVNTALQASFTLESNNVAAGSSVEFTNTSTSNSAALWNFGDGTFSSVFSPEHSYSATYLDSTLEVYLIAMNLQGCVDTAFQSITIERARIDLELSSLYLQKDNEWFITGVKLTNRGTVNLESADLWIETPNGLLFSESWTGNLAPQEEYIYVFNAQPGSGFSEHDKEDAFVCARGIGYDGNGIAESDLSNNAACSNIEGENVILMPIYPNPATDEINVQLIVSKDSDVSVQLMDARGRVILTIVPEQSLAIGLYSYHVNIEQIGAGAYFLRLLSGDSMVMKKILIGE